MYVPISNKQCFTIMHDGMMAVTVLVLFTVSFAFYLHIPSTVVSMMMRRRRELIKNDYMDGSWGDLLLVDYWMTEQKQATHSPASHMRKPEKIWKMLAFFWLLLQQLKAQQVCLWLSVPFSFFFCRCRRRRLRHHHPFIFTKNPYKRHNNKKNIVFRIKLVNEMFRCCCILICIFLMFHLLLCIG